MERKSASVDDKTAQALEVIGAQVHTYESFGRAIVSHVISEMSRMDGPVGDRAVSGQFSVRAVTRGSSTDESSVHCVLVTVNFGGTTYSVIACVEIPDIHIETF